MDTTYTIIGSDGQQYGPITLDQVKGWVAEGRIGPGTQVMRSDTQSWLPAAQYVELGLASAPPAGSAVPAALVTEHPAIPALRSQSISGADWFYWIAGLSLVTSVLAKLGTGGIAFAAGLGTTRIIDYYARHMGSTGNAVALVLDIVAVAFFAMFGLFARKGHTWSFIVGMVFYALDGLIVLLLVGADLFSLGFHAFALFCIFAGLRANLQMKALLKGQVV